MHAELPELDADEVHLSGPSDELLYRQVHPGFVDQGIPGTRVFQPMPKDEGKLSVARGSALTAQEAYDQYVADGFASWGVLAISVDQATEAGFRVIDDSKLADTPEGHAYVDFRHLGGKAAKRAAVELTQASRSHGVLYRPPEPDR